MTSKTRKLASLAALFGMLSLAVRPGMAQRKESETIGATHGQIAGAVAGIAAGGALVGVLAYVAVKHSHTVTGCTQSGQNGLLLTSDSDKKTYLLVGEVTGIKGGERVRVSGKKGKEKSADPPELLVEKVTRDLGPCEVAGAQR
jgi:hypothetical protein